MYFKGFLCILRDFLSGKNSLPPKHKSMDAVRKLFLMMSLFKKVTHHTQHRELGAKQRENRRGGLDIECFKDKSRVISGKKIKQLTSKHLVIQDTEVTFDEYQP